MPKLIGRVGDKKNRMSLYGIYRLEMLLYS